MTWSLRRKHRTTAATSKSGYKRDSGRSLLDPDCPLVSALVFDVNGNRRVRNSGETIGPLDRDDCRRRRQLIETQIVDFTRNEAVQIDVLDRQAPRVWLEKRERRTGDSVWVPTGALDQSSDKRRLPGAQLPVQENGHPTLQLRHQLTGDADRIRLAVTRIASVHDGYASSAARGSVTSCTA